MFTIFCIHVSQARTDIVASPRLLPTKPMLYNPALFIKVSNAINVEFGNLVPTLPVSEISVEYEELTPTATVSGISVDNGGLDSVVGSWEIILVFA